MLKNPSRPATLDGSFLIYLMVLTRFTVRSKYLTYISIRDNVIFG